MAIKPGDTVVSPILKGEWKVVSINKNTNRAIVQNDSYTHEVSLSFLRGGQPAWWPPKHSDVVILPKGSVNEDGDTLQWAVPAAYIDVSQVDDDYEEENYWLIEGGTAEIDDTGIKINGILVWRDGQLYTGPQA